MYYLTLENGQRRGSAFHGRQWKLTDQIWFGVFATIRTLGWKVLRGGIAGRLGKIRESQQMKWNLRTQRLDSSRPQKIFWAESRPGIISSSCLGGFLAEGLKRIKGLLSKFGAGEVVDSN
jgi:hypothetical protein